MIIATDVRYEFRKDIDIDGRDSKATPRSGQNLSYPTPPRNTGWYLSPPPGWKPPTYTDALADPERYTRVDPHDYFTHLPGQNDPNPPR